MVNAASATIAAVAEPLQSIRIKRDAFREAKVAAAKAGLSLAEWVSLAIIAQAERERGRPD